MQPSQHASGQKTAAIASKATANDMESRNGISMPAPVQRVKIKLKNEDKHLLDKLRDVPVVNAGGQTLNDPSGVGTLHEIGIDENIIFEGHGYYDNPFWGEKKVVEQGGIPPDKLAKLARDVPKPKNWTGHIILLGCTTGDITEQVSIEYYKLTKSAVKVIGTQKNIKVGTGWDDVSFVGTDWEAYPGKTPPADLAFVRELLAVTRAFWPRVMELIAVISQLNELKENIKVYLATEVRDKKIFEDSGFRRDFKTTTSNVTTLFAQAENIIKIDVTSRNHQVGGKQYGYNERKQLHDWMVDTMDELRKITCFTMPDQVLFSINIAKGNIDDRGVAITAYLDLAKQVDDASNAVDILVAQGSPVWHKLLSYFLGLGLKKIDLANPAEAVHKKKGPQESFWGTKWIDVT
ncbi:hypothetical protein [Chitinophaga sp. MM2321]|uniref:hypothetical protein n=1 Tax=Chitinophaga sp. MM2321 TaxID=3137178 RepID=UPI0032D58FCE